MSSNHTSQAFAATSADPGPLGPARHAAFTPVTRPRQRARPRAAAWLLGLALLGLLAGACAPKAPETRAPLVVSAIPDQDPEKLQRLYGSLSTYLSEKLHVPVTYKPVADYRAAVLGFKVGDLQLVWFGGLTGVQARLQVPGARAVAQRDIDAEFQSVFITSAGTGIRDVPALRGRSFTFGSETSTSGRLMPQYFMEQQGVKLADLKGAPGFSGSHDKTIELVSAGTFEAGAVNGQVWKSRLAEGKIDTAKVAAFWTTPPYHDYHWLLHPSTSARYGADFADRLRAALLALDPAVPAQAQVLELFGARRFIAASEGDYGQIEQIGRSTGLIADDASGR